MTKEFLEITAAADGGDGKKCPKVKGVAYSGGKMRLFGWSRPVVVDLNGIAIDDKIPLLANHENNTMTRVGLVAAKVEGGALLIDGEIVADGEVAAPIVSQGKAGADWQLSIGAEVEAAELVEDGRRTVNGQEHDAPFYHVTKSTLREVSVVAVGADKATRMQVTASLKLKGVQQMEPEKKETPAKKVEAAAVEASQTAERERVASVIEACKNHADIMAQAVKEGWTADKAELACLRAEKAEAEQNAIEAKRPAAPSIIDLKAAAPKDAKTVVAAACMGAAMPDAKVEATCKGVDLDAAHDLGIHRLSDVFAAFGFNYRPGDVAATEKALRAAFSTADIPNVLSNVAHKFTLKGFGDVGDDWRLISRSVPVVDFKAVKGVRLVMGGLLQPLAKGGELKHVSLSDESRDLAAATKGSIIGITREDLINDDLGVLSAVPERFGQMAGRTINKDVFASLSTTGSDYGANTTGALTMANLSAAFALAMGIKDADGNPLGAMPTRILVSPAKYLDALNIYQSEQLIGSGSEKGKTNVMRGVFEPVKTVWLAGNAYWLFDPSFPLVDVAFLNGRTTPVVETANADFNQLGIQMRCYFDYGVGAGELKAALYSTGA